jgi:hypothetical protein
MSIWQYILGWRKTDPMLLKVPNTRRNAFMLGYRLMLAALNPWSGIEDAARGDSWQPIDPWGWPHWWPAGAIGPVGSDQVSLMWRVLPRKWQQR